MKDGRILINFAIEIFRSILWSWTAGPPSAAVIGGIFVDVFRNFQQDAIG
jgi:hypothetical protein